MQRFRGAYRPIMPIAVLRYSVVLLTALLCAQAALPAEWEGQSVAEIRFVPSTQPLAELARRPLLRVEVAKPLTAADVRLSIHNLFATGRYANIEVDATVGPAGAIVTFYTEPNWFVGAVTVEGVDGPPNVNQLVNATGLRLGELYTPRRQAEALSNLRELLIVNGLMSPLIAAEVQHNPDTQQAEIRFVARHLPRARFGRLLLTGDSDWNASEVGDIAGWKPGKEFSFERLQRGLERLRTVLRKQGYWQAEISVATRDYLADENVIDLVINATKGPIIQVRIEGLELGDRRKTRLLPVYEQGASDAGLIAEGARNLRDFLQLKGFLDANVEYELERARPEESTVVYRVDRGRRMKVASVNISGVRYFDMQTIRERILVREATVRQRRGSYSTGLLQRDVDTLRNLYLLNGFRDVEITTNLNTDRGVGELSIAVDEGTPTIVSRLEVHGDEVYPIADRYFELASAEGQAFSEAQVATDRDLILGDYFDSGYQDATFSWTVTPTDDPGRVELTYDIVEGDRLFVDRTIVDGYNHTQPELVSDQILLIPSVPLSQTAMFETQRRLYDLGIFTKVDIRVQNPEGSEDTKTLLVELQEARRWTYGLGLGGEYGNVAQNVGESDSRFVPRATVEVTRLNVRGKGHTLSLRSRFSELQQRILFSYENPRWTGSENWKMLTSALLDRFQNFSTFAGRKIEGVFQLEQNLSRPSTALYRYTYRRTVLDESVDPSLVPPDERAVRTALLAGTYIQDRRDDPTDSTQGIFNSIDLSFASKYWGSEPNFFRVFGQNSSYYSLTRRVVLARTTQVGFFIPWGPMVEFPAANEMPVDTPFGEPDDRIPLVERFFGGGASSNRGFAINEAGPRSLTTGGPIGGGVEFLNSVELRFPLLGESTKGVLFHDAGNVYSRLSNFSFRVKQPTGLTSQGEEAVGFDYMVHAVGAGLRYKTPIGPIRVDVGYALNPPRYFRDEIHDSGGGLPPTIVRTEQQLSNFQFHFSLGQTF